MPQLAHACRFAVKVWAFREHSGCAESYLTDMAAVVWVCSICAIIALCPYIRYWHGLPAGVRILGQVVVWRHVRQPPLFARSFERCGDHVRVWVCMFGVGVLEGFHRG